MVDDLEGASMPDGIDVDEAAAYFGVFESSDALHQMMEMPREAAFERFFALLSDLVLKPGEFDFKEASERLSCEGGEIYFLVAGHLGVMSIPEQLTLAIEEGQFSEDDAVVLNELTDPMRLLKLFAIAYQTGGEGESTKYLKSIETMMMKPAANKDLLLTLASEMKGAFDVSGHVTPIPSLASESANASAVEAADITPLPPREVEEKKSVAKTPAKTEPKIEKLVEEKVEEKVEKKVEDAVPLPKIEKEEKIPLPKVEKVVEVDNRKETEKAEDAFSGAFGLIEKEPEPEVKPEITEELETAVSVEEKEEVAEESENSETDTSLEDAFAAADVDGSGGLSIEEVAEATGLDIEEAAKLHAEADVDGDGQVTLEELKSKPEVVEKMALPKPVKPVRAGVANPQAQQPVQQQSWQQQQQAAQQQAWQQQQLQQQQAAQQQAWQQQQLQQQQAWQQQQQLQQQLQQQQAWQQQQQAQQQGWNQPAQPIQPTIQSGLTCRGCGIGVDANWRFCPVCGTQNR